MKATEKKIGLIYLVITICLFSTFEVTSKGLSAHMGPTQITFTRFLIGGIVLLPFAIARMARKRIRLTGIDFAKAGALGIVNIVISMGLIQWGLVYANASVSAALFSVNPLFVMLFARPLLGERITAPKAAGLLLGIAGIAILFADGVSEKTSTPFGLVLILASSVCFALYTVLGKKLITRDVDSLIVTTFSFLIGSACMVPIQLAMNVPLIPDVMPVMPQLLYMSVAITGIAYVTYFEGLSRLDAGAGSTLYFAKPAMASLLAVALLGERVSAQMVIGILVVAAGIFAAQTGKNKSA